MRATWHTFGHSFAAHLLQGEYDIRRVQAMRGHRDVRTTTSYLHVVQWGGLGVGSRLDGALAEERGARRGLGREVGTALIPDGVSGARLRLERG